MGRCQNTKGRAKITGKTYQNTFLVFHEATILEFNVVDESYANSGGFLARYLPTTISFFNFWHTRNTVQQVYKIIS